MNIEFISLHTQNAKSFADTFLDMFFPGKFCCYQKFSINFILRIFELLYNKHTNNLVLCSLHWYWPIAQYQRCPTNVCRTLALNYRARMVIAPIWSTVMSIKGDGTSRQTCLHDWAHTDKPNLTAARSILVLGGENEQIFAIAIHCQTVFNWQPFYFSFSAILLNVLKLSKFICESSVCSHFY